jgi:hypothetical protein
MTRNAERLQIVGVGLFATFGQRANVINFSRLCAASCGSTERAELILRLQHEPTPETLPGMPVTAFCGGSAIRLLRMCGAAS